jgi:putative flippase GtrA
MKALIARHETKLRFIMVGGFNTLFGLAAYPVLFFVLKPLHLHYLVVLVLAYCVCIVFSFSTIKLLVFRTKGQQGREFGRFVTFNVLYLLLNLLALPVLVEFLGLSPVWGQMMFATLLVVSSYFWHSHITFSRQHPS